MSYEYAIARAKATIEEAAKDESSVCYVTKEDKEWLVMAIDALEKQNGKIPHKREHVKWKRYCPRCQKQLFMVTSDYCTFCGQRLDWSAE